jgi:hypothetical protein
MYRTTRGCQSGELFRFKRKLNPESPMYLSSETSHHRTGDVLRLNTIQGFVARFRNLFCQKRGRGGEIGAFLKHASYLLNFAISTIQFTYSTSVLVTSDHTFHLPLTSKIPILTKFSSHYINPLPSGFSYFSMASEMNRFSRKYFGAER